MCVFFSSVLFFFLILSITSVLSSWKPQKIFHQGLTNIAIFLKLFISISFLFYFCVYKLVFALHFSFPRRNENIQNRFLSWCFLVNSRFLLRLPVKSRDIKRWSTAEHFKRFYKCLILVDLFFKVEEKFFFNHFQGNKSWPFHCLENKCTKIAEKQL